MVQQFSAQISPSQLLRRDQKIVSTIAVKYQFTNLESETPQFPLGEKCGPVTIAPYTPSSLWSVVSRLTTTGVSRDINLKGDFDKLVHKTGTVLVFCVGGTFTNHYQPISATKPNLFGAGESVSLRP